MMWVLENYKWYAEVSAHNGEQFSSYWYKSRKYHFTWHSILPAILINDQEYILAYCLINKANI